MTASSAVAVAGDPSHRHGYDPDSLMAWRKARLARCPATYQQDGMTGTRCVLPPGHDGDHAYTLSGDA